jgi:hypothetical protein
MRHLAASKAPAGHHFLPCRWAALPALAQPAPTLSHAPASAPDPAHDDRPYVDHRHHPQEQEGEVGSPAGYLPHPIAGVPHGERPSRVVVEREAEHAHRPEQEEGGDQSAPGETAASRPGCQREEEEDHREADIAPKARQHSVGLRHGLIARWLPPGTPFGFSRRAKPSRPAEWPLSRRQHSPRQRLLEWHADLGALDAVEGWLVQTKEWRTSRAFGASPIRRMSCAQRRTATKRGTLPAVAPWKCRSG